MTSQWTKGEREAVRVALLTASACYERQARVEVKRATEAIANDDNATLSNQLHFLQVCMRNATEDANRAELARQLADTIPVED